MFLKNEQIELEKQGLITEATEETEAMFGRKKIITVKLFYFFKIKN